MMSETAKALQYGHSLRVRISPSPPNEKTAKMLEKPGIWRFFRIFRLNDFTPICTIFYKKVMSN
jgi:hypothetical protein